MRRPMIIATTAGAALAAGLIGVPALAGAATGTTPGATPSASATYPCGATADGSGTGPGGWGMRNGRGAGAGNGAGMGNRAGAGNGAGMGNGRGAGAGGGMMWTGDPLTGLAQGTLSADQKTKLAGMAEEEKLAHDVYVALAAKNDDVRFTRIPTAETRHLTEVRALLSRYGVADPTAGKADGQFASADVQQQYQDLVARGSASPDAALAVGRDIENADLKELSTAGSGVTAQDVSTVYARLANASRMHLRAFGG
jgi:hypothetical protein